MSTPTIEQIVNHRTIRQYKEDPVSKEMIESIILAGQRGSTSSNLQAYSVVAVLDSEKRDRLFGLCGNQAHIRQAPVFLTWCADLARLDSACRMHNYTQNTDYTESFLVAAVDVAIAMQSATIAAESLGLGMCYIGAIRNNPKAVIELLGLPHHTFPISGMTLGWPEAEGIYKPRLPLSAVLHWEEYNDENFESELIDYDQMMIKTGIYERREKSVGGKKNEVAIYGWTEHSARRVSRQIRTGLRQSLAEQGFELL